MTTDKPRHQRGKPTALLVAAHPDYPNPLEVAEDAVALAPLSFKGLPLVLALDERCSPEHIRLLPYRETWIERLRRRFRT